MGHRFINYQQHHISYYCFGTGSQPIICFHGYGEAAIAFAFLEQPSIASHFRFYAIDLPVHGLTQWNKAFNLLPGDLEKIVLTILEEDNSKAGEEKLILLGFSLGGRMALQFVEQRPELTDKMILLAPDGLKVNFWYWLATQTYLGSRLFSYTMRSPGWFFSLLDVLNKWKFVNASVFKFVKYYIDNPQLRQELYERWMLLRKIKPDLSYIKKQVRQKNIPVRLLYGRHDRIILSSVGEKFQRGIESQCSIHIIAAGHQVLHEKHAEEIVAAILH